MFDSKASVVRAGLLHFSINTRSHWYTRTLFTSFCFFDFSLSLSPLFICTSCWSWGGLGCTTAFNFNFQSPSECDCASQKPLLLLSLLLLVPLKIDRTCTTCTTLKALHSLSLSFSLSLQTWDSKGYVRAQILHLYFLFLFSSLSHSLFLCRFHSLSLPFAISLGNFRTNSAAPAHLILKDTVWRLILQEPLILSLFLTHSLPHVRSLRLHFTLFIIFLPPSLLLLFSLWL